jgi:DUF2971 family protein
MRVYHFLPAEFALDDIQNRRIRISEIDQLNDPFELWCVAQPDRRLRQALRGFKKQLNESYGMLCFSRRWRNPLLWSHYAEKHRGMCLGFDVDRRRRGLKAVAYVKERIDLHIPPTRESIEQLLFTKYRDWKYEEEWRCWSRLEERNPSGYFYPFDEKVQLREVIAGPLCVISRGLINGALKGYKDIRVIKARLAFKTFRVVTNKRAFPS